MQLKFEFNAPLRSGDYQADDTDYTGIIETIVSDTDEEPIVSEKSQTLDNLIERKKVCESQLVISSLDFNNYQLDKQAYARKFWSLRPALFICIGRV